MKQQVTFIKTYCMKKLSILLFFVSFCMTLSATPPGSVLFVSSVTIPAKGISAVPQTKKPGFISKLVQKLVEKKLKKLYRKADKETGDGLALASLILGALSLVLIFLNAEALFFIGIGAAVAAVVMGFVSKKKGGGKDWKAIVGISLGFTTILLVLIAIALVAAFIAAL